jgi:hypothetical protein
MVSESRSYGVFIPSLDESASGCLCTPNRPVVEYVWSNTCHLKRIQIHCLSANIAYYFSVLSVSRLTDKFGTTT